MDIIEFTENFNTFYISGNGINKWVTEVKLQDYEKDFLTNLVENRFTINLYSRQMNISTLLGAYCAYNLINNKDEAILFITQKREQGVNFLERVKLILKNFCEKTKISFNELIEIDAKTELRFKNGNKIITNKAHKDSLRGSRYNKIIIDSASHMENLEEFYSMIIPVMGTVENSSLHLVGQATGNQFFQKLYFFDNGFKKLKYHYSLNPIRYSIEKIQDLKSNFINHQADWDQEMELIFPEIQIKQNKGNLLQVRVSDDLYSKIGKCLIEKDCTLSDYLRKLIEKDLQS